MQCNKRCPLWANSGHSGQLLDDLVGAREQRGRHRDAKCLSGLEVDYQVVLGRNLNRKIGWLLALEDSINIASRSPVLFQHTRPIRDEAAAGDKEPLEVNSRQLIPSAQCDD